MNKDSKIALSTILTLMMMGLFVVLFSVDFESPREIAHRLNLKISKVASPSKVYSSSGELIGTFKEESRSPVSLTKLPLHVIQPFLAAEDKDFFNHAGVNPQAILRSMAANIRQKKLAQGGSTITQQLIRQHLLSRKKSFPRKINEIYLSLALERELTKAQILELWLNSVYLGNNAYGIEAASQAYFSKSASLLSRSEAALLAGVIQAPTKLAPHRNLKSAMIRRQYVLDQLRDSKWINSNQFNLLARQEPKLTLSEESILVDSPWITESVRAELWKTLDFKGLSRVGAKIYTSVDRLMQKKIEQKLVPSLSSLRAKGLETAFVAVDIPSGDIRAMIGGLDFKESQFNRAIQITRPIGEALFPVVYALASDSSVSISQNNIPISTSAVQSRFQDADKVAAMMGYGNLRRILNNAGVIVDNPVALESMTGSPYRVAQAWRLLSGRPITAKPSLMKKLVDRHGLSKNIEFDKGIQVKGISEQSAFVVDAWLQKAGFKIDDSSVTHYTAQHAWNHWSIVKSNDTLGVLWLGAESRSISDPEVFKKAQELAIDALNSWAKETGIIQRDKTIVKTVPNGISWAPISVVGSSSKVIVPFQTTF